MCPGGSTDLNSDGKVRTCGTMTVHRRLLENDPAYSAARARIENLAKEFRVGRQTARQEPAHIPVVVHVVHYTSAQNVSSAQVQSQIDALNRDFGKRNDDLAS